jgi:hypothetical protein
MEAITMIYAELFVLLCIVGLIGAAGYAGRVALGQMTLVLSEFDKQIVQSAERSKEVAALHANHLNSFANVTRQAMTDTVAGHVRLLGKVGDAHAAGSVALAETCQQLEASSRNIGQACRSLTDCATTIVEALRGSTLQEIHNEMKLLRKFVMPTGN